MILDSRKRAGGPTVKPARHQVRIPDCNQLFTKFFLPHYDDNDRQRMGKPAIRGDIVAGKKPGLDPTSLSPLASESRARTSAMIQRMVKAAQTDWSTYLKVEGKLSIQWIDGFDRHYTREKIKEVIDRSDPEDSSNDYLVISCEFGAALGTLMTQLNRNLAWVYESPYWESYLYHVTTGTVVNVFHWAFKKMSDYGVDDGFAEKVQACLALVESGKLDS